jgi:hypothetical protein
MKKSIFLLSILPVLLLILSCSNDDNETTNTNTIEPKTLLVTTSIPYNTYVTVQIKDSNNNVLQTKKDSLHVNYIFNIDKGSKVTLTMSVPGQTFAGSYQLTEDYGNIILAQDSFSNRYDSYNTTISY